MDTELKAYLLQILKNQAGIFANIDRIQSTLEDISPEVNEEINNIYKQIAESKFTIFQAEIKLLQAQIEGGLFN
jgi:hypothetical protein